MVPILSVCISHEKLCLRSETEQLLWLYSLVMLTKSIYDFFFYICIFFFQSIKDIQCEDKHRIDAYLIVTFWNNVFNHRYVNKFSRLTSVGCRLVQGKN